MITETSPILNLLLAKGVGTKTLSDVVEGLVSRNLSPGEVGIDALADELSLRAELKQNALAVQAKADELAVQLDRENIRILIRGIDRYPQRLVTALGKNAPPVLFVRGNLAIFEAKAVGFCGSRDASEKGINVAAESAGLLGARGVNVVSGYAKGVDLAAHCAALQAGGTTCFVLPEGILHFRAKREIKSLLTDDNYLVISEFSPRLPWNVRNAMQRNNTIIGFSDAMIVIESGTTGGTHACATSALSLGRPLFVAEYAAPAESAAGNKHFLNLGAIPLRGDRQARPNLTRVYEVLGLEGSDGNESTNAGVVISQSGEAPIAPEHIPVEQPTSKPDEHRMNHRSHPKRLIEVDLPIARISAHARREKSIRHGHISTLHIWWARRPLAACRAVICAALWPDPADEQCPQSFRDAAARLLAAFAKRVNPKKITGEKQQLQATLSPESRTRWDVFAKNDPPLDPADPAHQNVLRFALLDFIADFANWDNSTVSAYLETSRALTQAAHESLGGEPGTRPLVVDPFAGGGSIPLEALRVGADAFASDLNPVAVLLNKVVLEYIPKYGQKLADEVRKWGQWIKEQAEKELAEFYPKDEDGATPIAYLWARTIRCEGAVCGAEVPLITSLWLGKKPHRPFALKLIPDSKAKSLTYEVFSPKKATDVSEGTVRRGSVTCPFCEYTTPVKRVRDQLSTRNGGTKDAVLFCVVTTKEGEKGRVYRAPTAHDVSVTQRAGSELRKRLDPLPSGLAAIPDELLPPQGTLGFRVQLYGMRNWSDLFSDRQLLSLVVLGQKVRQVRHEMTEPDLATVVQLLLALTLDKVADYGSALTTWSSPASQETVRQTFGRMALPMVWDFAEAYPFAESSGGWSHNLEYQIGPIENEALAKHHMGTVTPSDAAHHPLPGHSVAAIVTDPPYYDAIPYADLSDFFLVWLKRSLVGSPIGKSLPALAPKENECVVDVSKGHDKAFFEKTMTAALAEANRYAMPSAVGVVVFAHKSTSGWEAQLNSLLDAGWTITGSWPIETERQGRVRANSSAALASSVHLVCRPRTGKEVGDWRDVLSELPQRMHEWMPRLANEGVVGADAIFACLGPALEIFSRYSRVEKANGDPVLLKEYLEHVWAAVSKEALSTILRDADASGLEPDARLTAMWLWTIGGGTPTKNGQPADDAESEDEEANEMDEGNSKSATASGFTLEFDAARMIAQGLGVHLERSESIVEVKGGKARLLPVAERTKLLFGKETEAGPTGARKTKKKVKQPSLFADLGEAEEAGGWKELKGPPPGTTILDRLHQAMILFGGQRGELLKRFLVEDGVGKDARFWKLAQSLAALYPPGTDERRWVEGVLARKKGLGL